MLRNIFISSVLFGVLALSATALQVVATDTSAMAQECDQACVTGLVQSSQIMTLSQLIVTSGVSQRGEILDAQLFQCSGKWFYVFRMLNKADNNVFGVYADAKSGAVVPRPC